ncbi:MAG TPA: hypothetical protein VHC22_23275 [Pirellulales bacterium]|nr:hypothetical protein [Pirellulales bacterium]
MMGNDYAHPHRTRSPESDDYGRITQIASWVHPLRYKAWLCLPGIIYMLVTWVCYHQGEQLTGDESHYLFVSESIVEDLDLDISNNLRRYGFRVPGWCECHCVERPHGWFSIHSIGLPALLALPRGLWGFLGVRLTMAALCGLAAPLLYRVIERVWKSPLNSLLIGLALALGMPFLAASNQVYPDLLAGVLLLFVVDCVLSIGGDTPFSGRREVLLSAALAFLPWLHMKYAVAALIALGWYFDATRRPRIVPAAVMAASLALLACYNEYAFGRPTGPLAHNSLEMKLSGLVVFVGLHFDQTQGMFFQQPLFLLGLVGLVPMWQASRRSSIWWALLYAAIIVPNAMHPNWYGGYSFIGRFGATNVLLWALPLGYAARTVLAGSTYLPMALAGLSLALQAVLAGSWLWIAENRFGHTITHECVWTYNSPYPGILKTYLPFWQPYMAWWHYSANVSALILATGMLACGWCWQRHRRQAVLCLAGAVLTAFGLAVAAHKESPPVTWNGQEIVGYIGGSDGERRVANEERDALGLLARTPALYLAPGDYRVSVDYQADGDAASIGALMFCNRRSQTLLYPLMSSGTQTKRDVAEIHVSSSEYEQPSFATVWYLGKGRLSVAGLSLERIVK